METKEINSLFMNSYGSSVYINEEDIKMITNKRFFQKVLNLNQQTIEIARLGGHVSFKNYKFSRKLCRMILTAINQCNGDEVKPYLEFVENMLFIQDEFK